MVISLAIEQTAVPIAAATKAGTAAAELFAVIDACEAAPTGLKGPELSSLSILRIRADLM